MEGIHFTLRYGREWEQFYFFLKVVTSWDYNVIFLDNT